MRDYKHKRPVVRGILLLTFLAVINVNGGDSGLNTVVVINQSSTNSCELGNYFCERRQVPPNNVLYVAWNGGNVSWTSDQFQTNLLNPLLGMLAGRQLTNQIDCVVLSMDFPFETMSVSGKVNSTTSALFYGLKDDSGPNWMDVTNSYCFSEQIFRPARPASAPGYSFLTTMLTAGSLAQAKQLVDQGVASDGTFPTQPVVLDKSSDTLRNVRYRAFDNAIFNTRLRGNYAIYRTDGDSVWGLTNLLGYQTGLANFSVSPNTFVPGAMADSLSSYGGVIFGPPTGQTTLLACINAGAAGSYGTVTEPSPNTQKFPDPQNYFYQSRGFSLAECYYQSIYAPYEGLIVAEPLAAPFAQAGVGNWIGIGSNAVLNGTAQLGLALSAADATRPLQQLDLFVDGTYFQTLTNVAPCPGDVLSVVLNGYPITYTVPANATVATVAAGLCATLNAPANTNATGVAAFLHGDRIELHCLATNGLASAFYFPDGTATNRPDNYHRAVYLPSPVPPQLSSSGRAADGTFRLHVETPTPMAYVIQASTNLTVWTPILTNSTGGPLDFVDGAAPAFPLRFYRIQGLLPDPHPQLTALGLDSGGNFRLRVTTGSALPYAIQASTNLADWIDLYTNLAGGTMDFTDNPGANTGRRFYRARVQVQTPPSPSLVTLPSPSGSGPLIRVAGAAQPYVLLTSSNLVQWIPMLTNLTVGTVQTAAGSSNGSAGALSTFLVADQKQLLTSPAQGLRGFSVSGTVQPGTWLQFNVTKTSGVTVSLGVTNQSSSAAAADLAQQLVNAVNSSPDLQGADGCAAGDYAVGWFGGAQFNLRARSPGYAAAAFQARLSGSSSLVLSPSTQLPLTQNLSDLQPRNHLRVTAGATSLGFSFPLDTTMLPDGFHELTAVAYEGSHVRTQTRTTVPIQVQNSPLAASLNLLDLADGASVQGAYHVLVAANTNTISTLCLYSTGGLLGTATNQSVATFTVNGAGLGAGLHPFYAIAQTSAGGQFRTQTRWVRLVNGP